jgi:hypothetical protein
MCRRAFLGFLFDPGKVPPALLGRHRTTDLKEVIQHVLLAFDPGMGGFQEEFFNLGSDLIRLIK